MCEIDQLLGELANLPQHRDRDDLGDNKMAMAIRRLAITDLDNGKQPMRTEDERHVLIYNRETYYYHELLNDLISKRYKFKTNSDTEVSVLNPIFPRTE